MGSRAYDTTGDSGHNSLWMVPKCAQSGDLIVAFVACPVPVLIRPHASNEMYRYVGQAIPCQTKASDLSTSMFLWANHKLMMRDSGLDKDSQQEEDSDLVEDASLIEEFVLE